jgi:hypothetical protein
MGIMRDKATLVANEESGRCRSIENVESGAQRRRDHVDVF